MTAVTTIGTWSFSDRAAWIDYIFTNFGYVAITLQSRFQNKSIPEMLDLHNAYKQRNREF